MMDIINCVIHVSFSGYPVISVTITAGDILSELSPAPPCNIFYADYSGDVRITLTAESNPGVEAYIFPNGEKQKLNIQCLPGGTCRLGGQMRCVIDRVFPFDFFSRGFEMNIMYENEPPFHYCVQILPVLTPGKHKQNFIK